MFCFLLFIAEFLPVNISCPYYIEKYVSTFGESIELTSLVTAENSVRTVVTPERIAPMLHDINRNFHIFAEASGKTGASVNCTFYVHVRRMYFSFIWSTWFLIESTLWLCFTHYCRFKKPNTLSVEKFGHRHGDASISSIGLIWNYLKT